MGKRSGKGYCEGCGWGLEAYIVPGDTNYSMILGRPWMREVGAIRLDAFDEY